MLINKNFFISFSRNLQNFGFIKKYLFSASNYKLYNENINLLRILSNRFLKISNKNFFYSKNLLRNRNYNFYDVLGVERESTNEQIKLAYLKLASQYHPDFNKEDAAEEKFKNLTLAYEALNNQRNRDLYDAYMDSDPYSSDGDYNFFREDDDFDKDRYKKKENINDK
jgi:hypothetical protein